MGVSGIAAFLGFYKPQYHNCGKTQSTNQNSATNSSMWSETGTYEESPPKKLGPLRFLMFFSVVLLVESLRFPCRTLKQCVSPSERLCLPNRMFFLSLES